MENKNKISIGITAYHGEDGKIKPLYLHWEDGRKFEVDRVLDVRIAASLKVGGHGMRYTCRIAGKQVYLFCVDNKWFVEK
ncbi:MULTISPECIES: hypothetical protein [Sporomusa]|uniref:Uncharacterized protein n=1 Tax=Sporomusa sphaeroides DSM 2875 TaxID=1337886 RepID=A0ABM9WAA1_9FIRM|nr:MULTISPECIES: hypothetical protein [Sporomusa]MCM0758692.1 hypothetical protein [Sporomusa sphaeroides DSM 2875]OLS56263.1 hypothetical protein SPSPH_26540 [Sporomusa sphaeroides DSM 2875]CVK21741.1 hypothetical protein SSPH_04450 [Sporomusa sphaeroides DSM 2875]